MYYLCKINSPFFICDALVLSRRRTLIHSHTFSSDFFWSDSSSASCQLYLDGLRNAGVGGGVTILKTSLESQSDREDEKEQPDWGQARPSEDFRQANSGLIFTFCLWVSRAFRQAPRYSYPLCTLPDANAKCPVTSNPCYSFGEKSITQHDISANQCARWKAGTILSMRKFIIVWAPVRCCHLILLIKDKKYDLAF